MAKLCTSCGNPLPRDDVRFCSKCGSVVAGASSTRPPLKEQIAFPSWPVHRLEDLPTSQVSVAPPLEQSRAQSRKPPLPLPPMLTPAYPEQQPFPEPVRQPWLKLNELPPVLPVPDQPTAVHEPVTPQVPVSTPGMQPIAPAQSAPQAAPRPASRPLARRRRKSRLVITSALLVVLLAGGILTWLFAFHPFDVPAITQAAVSFRNPTLGVSLQYPQGWTAQLDLRHSAASFYDANHTDQFNLNEATQQGLTIDQYIKNIEGQQSMTGPKTLPPLTFAGQSWQQVRGSALISGASYTETLLVTSRAGHLYALLLMAPASTYSSADHLFFAPVRSSFQFI